MHLCSILFLPTTVIELSYEVGLDLNYYVSQFLESNQEPFSLPVLEFRPHYSILSEVYMNHEFKIDTVLGGKGLSYKIHFFVLLRLRINSTLRKILGSAYFVQKDVTESAIL